MCNNCSIILLVFDQLVVIHVGLLLLLWLRRPQWRIQRVRKRREWSLMVTVEMCLRPSPQHPLLVVVVIYIPTTILAPIPIHRPSCTPLHHLLIILTMVVIPVDLPITCIHLRAWLCPHRIQPLRWVSDTLPHTHAAQPPLSFMHLCNMREGVVNHIIAL